MARKSRKKQPHHPACPCAECMKAIEKANESHRDNSVLDVSQNSRLKELSPEAAKTLGYIPANSR